MMIFDFAPERILLLALVGPVVMRVLGDSLRLVAALAVIWLAAWGPAVQEIPGAAQQAADLGRELLGRSMFVFQSAGLTILTAMVAATMVAIAPRKERKE